MGATKAVSEFVSTLEYDDVPEEVRTHAKRMLLDVVGVSLAAVNAEPVEIVRGGHDPSASEVSPSDGESDRYRIVGRGYTSDQHHAAMVNGVMAHVLDFDDAHLVMRGHPTVPVWPAVLAAGERANASGEELLTAFVAGVETELLLGEGLNPGHYEIGWHPTAIFGHLGSAAAVGSLRGLDPDQVANVVAIATSQAGGTKANFGTMTKPYHVGRAARAGLEAAQLAEEGFTGNAEILEEGFGGYCALYEGDPPHDFEDHLETLGDHWRTLEPPVHFKAYPCCGGTHEPIEAALAIYEDHDIDPDRIESVVVHRHPRRMPHIDRPDPTSGLDGKFSVQYTVTLALKQGDLWLEDFTDEAVADPETRRLLEKVTAREDPDLSERGTYVRVETESGEVYEQRLEARSTTDDEQLERKFRRCAAATLSGDAIDALYDSLTAVEDVEDVATLAEKLA